jgi:hypothetical protein
VYERRQIHGTAVSWNQPAKVLPMNPEVRAVVLDIEHGYETLLAQLHQHAAHLPSRVRSLLWILAALEPMAAHGHPIADNAALRADLLARLPQCLGTALVATA